jgi:hypothetical protein
MVLQINRAKRYYGMAISKRILNSIGIKAVLGVCLLCVWGTPHQMAARTIELTSFGSQLNTGRVNSRSAFQAALAVMAKEGGGTVHIPAGQYIIDFPDLASDVDPKQATNSSILREGSLTAHKIIVVPANTTLLGDVDSAGKPTTIIHWKVTSVPLFGFVSASHSGWQNCRFVFDGTQPQFFPWSQEKYLSTVGFGASGLGAPYELSTVIYTIGSEELTFENLSFESGAKPLDNKHTLGFGIVSNGKGPVPVPPRQVLSQLAPTAKVSGGGLSGTVRGNVFKSLRFSAFVMGVLATGQEDPVFEDISGNWRGSWYRSFDPDREHGAKPQYIPAPGHLLYLSFQPTFDVGHSGEPIFHGLVRNKNVKIHKVSEGSDTLSNYNSLGTLALKSIDGGTVQTVLSGHPAGLLQSMADTHNLSLQDLTWKSERDLCAEPDSKENCNMPTIILNSQMFTSPSAGFNENVIFRNVTLRSKHHSARFQIDAPNLSTESAAQPANMSIASTKALRAAPPSHHIRVDGLLIECPPKPPDAGSANKGIIQVAASETSFRNVTYTPLPMIAAPSEKVNPAVVLTSVSSNSAVDIRIHTTSSQPVDGRVSKVIDERPAAEHGTITMHSEQ